MRIKLCHDGMLQDTNSLDGAQMFMSRFSQLRLNERFICAMLVIWVLYDFALFVSNGGSIHLILMTELNCSRAFIWEIVWIFFFKSTAYFKFANLQYVSSGFRCRVITGSLMRLY